jgi:hypothetical protein
MDMVLLSLSLVGSVKIMMGLNSSSVNLYVTDETMAYLV